jgi:pyruvate dehydrogenase E2 component (dihydrolipoamide acetyltransferase)
LRREIGLVLACDHRVLDGVTAAIFMNRIIAALEPPLSIFGRPSERSDAWTSP